MTEVISSKGAIRKSILRNVEVPLESSKNKNANFNSDKNPCRQRSSSSEQKQLQSSKNQKCDAIIPLNREKYNRPELNTVLGVKEKLEKIHFNEPSKIESLSQLTPKSRNIVAQEVTKHLNFPANKEIYKDLIAINVNDSVLMIPEKRKPIRKKYTGKTSKDPIPELSDFLRPIEPLKYVIPMRDKIHNFRKPKNDNFNEFYELHSDYHFEF